MSLLQWLFRTKPEAPSTSERFEQIIDDVAALTRAVRRVQEDVADMREELTKRFGRVWARLKALRTDEPDGEVPTSHLEPEVGSQASGLREWRARRFGGLLR